MLARGHACKKRCAVLPVEAEVAKVHHRSANCARNFLCDTLLFKLDLSRLYGVARVVLEKCSGLCDATLFFHHFSSFRPLCQLSSRSCFLRENRLLKTFRCLHLGVVLRPVRTTLPLAVECVQLFLPFLLSLFIQVAALDDLVEETVFASALVGLVFL